jgi:outer membrane protein
MKKNIFSLVIFSAFSLILNAQDTLSLMQAIELGLENNYGIQLQKNDWQVAQNNNAIGNAGFLPSVDLEVSGSGSESTSNAKYLSGTEKNVRNAMNNAFGAGIELSWTLFDGMKMFANKMAFQELENLGETQVRLSIENTVSSIILTYFGIVQQKKLIQVQQDAVGLSMERKIVAAAKISIGSGSKMMLLQSSVDLNADSAALIHEVAQLKSLKADLNRTLGRYPETGFLVWDMLEINDSLDYKDLLSNLESQNTDIMIARSNQRITALALSSSRSDRFPKLDLDAAYNFNLSNSQSGFLEYNRAYGPNLGLTMSYNIFNGFNTNRNIKNARIITGSSELELKDRQLYIRTQLYKTFGDYQLNLDIIKLETSNCDVARTNVEVAVEKYKLGAISDFELREIQVKYIDAQYQLLLSQFKAKQAETELLRMSGEMYKMMVK